VVRTIHTDDHANFGHRIDLLVALTCDAHTRRQGRAAKASAASRGSRHGGGNEERSGKKKQQPATGELSRARARGKHVSTAENED
jgi:hypothetical protein